MFFWVLVGMVRDGVLWIFYQRVLGWCVFEDLELVAFFFSGGSKVQALL